MMSQQSKLILEELVQAEKDQNRKIEIYPLVNLYFTSNNYDLLSLARDYIYFNELPE